VRDIILASTSSYRRLLLERLCLPFRCEAPLCDEGASKDKGVAPADLARELARLKAMSVAERNPGAIVIGSDQVCALGDEPLGKPGSRRAALEQLCRLQGRSHLLFTAVCVIRNRTLHEFMDVSVLSMRSLTGAEIESYVDRDQPFDCAGSYKLESGGISLFDSINSEDHTAITGLPLLALGGLLRRLARSIDPG